MKKQIGKETYSQLIRCLSDLNLFDTIDKINESLYIDNAIVNLGFKKEPPYIIDIDIDKSTLDNIMDYLETLYKTDYDKFDNYAEVYNLFGSIKKATKDDK